LHLGGIFLQLGEYSPYIDRILFSEFKGKIGRGQGKVSIIFLFVKGRFPYSVQDPEIGADVFVEQFSDFFLNRSAQENGPCFPRTE
jgi:hypothetical protein